MKETILKQTAIEYYEVAKSLKNKPNSTVILYFKALVALTDLFILQQTGETPSNHNKRFQITKTKYPEVYDLLDKDFPFYQDSYNQVMSQELAEVIKEDVQTMAKKTNIELS